VTRTLILLAIGFVEGALAMAFAIELAYRIGDRRRRRRAQAALERHFRERGEP